MEKHRERYVVDCIDTHPGLPHLVRREDVYEDVISLYENKDIFMEYPLYIKFIGERAVDTGGVCRDLFSAYWEKANEKCFDGDNTLVPAVHPHVQMSLFPLVGAIFSHGFMSCGFMPVRLTFPTIALGPSVTIPDSVVIVTFQDFLSVHDRSVLQSALNECGSKVKYTEEMVTKLIYIYSQFSCRQRPTPQNLICQIAKHEFITKPLAGLMNLNSGIPTCHVCFWNAFSVERLYRFYNAVKGSPQHVLSKLVKPFAMYSSQHRIFNFLTTFIGNLTENELATFLRFVTGQRYTCVIQYTDWNATTTH